MVDDFFTGENDPARREGGFAHDSKVAPDMGIAVSVGALHVKNSDIGSQRANGD